VLRSEGALRSGVREVLAEMEKAPQTFSHEAVAEDEGFLQQLSAHILDTEKFVAGSFQQNLAAWEELLGGSSRQSSRKVLKWIREGVQPLFEGTQNTEPKKDEEGQIDAEKNGSERTGGTIPHWNSTPRD
jgi:hypothetical protein